MSPDRNMDDLLAEVVKRLIIAEERLSDLEKLEKPYPGTGLLDESGVQLLDEIGDPLTE